MVYYDVLLDDLHLHDGAVPYELETLPSWNLQHDWPHGVNIVTANSSFGESTTARMYIVERYRYEQLVACLRFIFEQYERNKDSDLSIC